MFDNRPGQTLLWAIPTPYDQEIADLFQRIKGYKEALPRASNPAPFAQAIARGNARIQRLHRLQRDYRATARTVGKASTDPANAHSGDPNYDDSLPAYSGYGQETDPFTARYANREFHRNFNPYSVRNLMWTAGQLPKAGALLGNVLAQAPGEVMASSSMWTAELLGMSPSEVESVGRISHESPGVQFASSLLPGIGQLGFLGSVASPVFQSIDQGSFKPIVDAGGEFIEGMNVFRPRISTEERFVRALNLGTLALGIAHGRRAMEVSAKGIYQDPVAMAHSMETLVRTDPSVQQIFGNAGIGVDDFVGALRRGVDDLNSRGSNKRGRPVKEGLYVPATGQGYDEIRNTIHRERSKEWGGSLFSDRDVLELTMALLDKYNKAGLLDTVSLEIRQKDPRPGTAGAYEPGSERVRLYRDIGDGIRRPKGEVLETLVHEFSHHMEKFLTADELSTLKRQYELERVRSTDRRKEYRYSSFSEWWAFQVTERAKVNSIYSHLAQREPPGLRRAWAKSRVALDLAVHVIGRKMAGAGHDYVPEVLDSIFQGGRQHGGAEGPGGRQLMEDLKIDTSKSTLNSGPIIRPWRPKG